MKTNPSHLPPQPLLLGIESSGKACSAGLARGSELLAGITANIRNIHSQKLAPFIEHLFELTAQQMSDLQAVVLSAGPGSFTGLRIGYSVAKGIAHALNIPVVEIPTLEIWAQQAGASALPVFPLIDAHRNEVFGAIYQWEDQTLVRQTDYQVLGYQELAEFIRQPALVCGADALRLQDKIEGYLPQGCQFIRPQPEFPQLWALMQLGCQRFNQQLFSSAHNCEPLYLRAFQGVL